MNASLWQLAGWTMIHSLWLGAAVALAGGFLRLACRRATPNTRYAISLATLALLAAAPIAAAAWLSVNGVPLVETALLPLPRGEGRAEGPSQAIALPISLPLPIVEREPDEQLVNHSSPAIIDLAQATPAELDALAAQQQTPQALPTNSPASFPLPPALLLPPSDHQSPITSHPPTTYSPAHLLTSSLTAALPLLPTLWLIGAPLTFTLLATGLVGSERLRRRATPLTAGIAFDACQRLRHTLTITRRVALAVSDDVVQPILVGIVRPLILLPAAALAGWTPEQLDMVLLHELAHVRRWDNLVNLLQRIVESLLFFHPAVWLVSRQVRRDREECCDAAVIRHTDRPHQYAELLVSIAAALRGGPAPSLAVAGAMASHPLAGRIRRILNIEAEPMRITRRTLAATLLLPLLLAGAIFYSGASAEDSPPVKEQSSAVNAVDDAESTSLNNAEEPNESSARAKLIDDKLEEDATPIRTVYPIPPGTLVDPIELAKALQSRHPAEIDWAEHQQGIIVSATQDVHERVAALIKKSAAKTAKFTDDTFKPIMAHNLIDGDNAPLIGGYGILEEFPAGSDQSEIDAAIERLKAEKRSFSVEQSDNGSKRIVDQTPPPKKPTAKKSLPVKDVLTQYKQLRELFTATDANPVVAMKYPVPAGVSKFVEDMFAGLESDPYGPQISFHRVWSDDQRSVEVTAPTEAQTQYLGFIFGALSLESSVRQLEKAQNSESTTTSPATDASSTDAQGEIPQLKSEIRNLESLIAKTQAELVDIEVFKELSAHSGPGNSALEAAVAEELDRDPTINQYHHQLRELQATHQAKQAESKNSNSLEIKRLRESMQAAEAELAKYRSEAERAVRKKLAKTPNEALRAAMAEYKIRRLGLEVQLAEYQQRLIYFKQKLAETSAQLGMPQAIGTYPTPTIAAAEAVQQQISDKQRPAKTTILDALDSAKSPAEKQAAFKQLAAVFAPSDANPPMTVIYDAPPGDDMRERIEGIFVSIEKDPYGPQISPSTRRWLNDDRNIEITAPRRAHDLYLHDFFHHLSFFAQIRDVLGEPLPTDETAMGENSPQPPNQSDESTENLKLGHEALAAVIANAQGRFEHQLAELQQRTAGREQTEPEVALTSALKSKILGMQVLEANRKAMQTRRLADAGAPSSLNLYAAAAGSDANDAQPTANASPNSADGALIAPPLPDKATLSSEIARLESQVTQSKKEIAQLTVFDQLARIVGNPRPHFEPVIREVAQLDPAVETAIKQLDAVNEKLRSMASGTTPLDDHEVRQLQRQRQEATEQLNNAREQFVEEQLALLSRLNDDELRKKTTERRRRLNEASKELATYQLDLTLAKMIAGSPNSSVQGGAGTGSNYNAHTTIKFPPTPAKPASDFEAITVMQSPTSQKTSIFGGTVTTAYLKVKFDRLPYSVDAPSGRLSPQEIERNSMNCLALVKSPSVLKAALKSFTPQAAQDMWQDQAVVWLLDRLSATFPGDGEILELKLEGGDAKEDSALLQAVIDAFLAAMKAPPESPADPNAAAVPPGYLSPYLGSNFKLASAATEYPQAFASALEQSRQAGQPVIVHFLAHDSEPSQRFVDDVLADEQVVKFIDEHFIPVTIYADDEPALAKKFQVSRVPANFFVFNGNARTGGFAVPATPAAYVVQLQQMYNITTNLASSPIPGEPMPATPPVPVADRPGDEQQTVASDAAPVQMEGLKLLKEFPADADPDELKAIEEKYRKEGYEVRVQRVPETGAFRIAVAAKIATAQPEAEQPAFLYDGKTFDQWRDLWKFELNPERRIEAINAMAAFNRAGRGDEALNAILDVAAEYDFSTIDPDDPEGKLKERIIKLFTDYPGAGAYQDPWLPIVLDRMQAAPDKWRPLLEMLLYRCMPPHRTQYPGSPPIMSAANVELLKKAAGDERLDASNLFLTTLNSVAAQDPDVIRMTKEALQSDDVENALNLLRGISFAHVDELPEQLEFLFAPETATRQAARDALARALGPQVRDAVADKLLAILNDANQSARHADAIRALAMFSGNIHPMSQGQNLSPQKRQEIIDALDKVSREGTPDLLPPALAALQLIYTDPDNSQASARSAFNAERLKLLDASKQQIEEEKQSLLKGTSLGEQRGGGFF